MNANDYEAAYQEHIAREDSERCIHHPDGCWYCGGDHYSTDCHEKDEDQ